jgi:hypothetical protein
MNSVYDGDSHRVFAKLIVMKLRFLNICRCPGAAFAIILGLTGCATAPQPPLPKGYPVRCTAEVSWPTNLTLEQLKDLPVKELIHPETGIDGVAMSKEDSTNCVVARTWREFDRYGDQGFQPADNANLQMSGWFIKTRSFIPFLEKAQPASNSFVHDLKMNRALLAILPIDLGPQVSNEETEAVQKAIREGKTWRDYYPETKIKKHTQTMIQLEVEDWMIYIRVLAFGDFDHDGCEDVLLCVTHAAIGGTWVNAFPVILTRRDSKHALEKINQ